MQEIILGLGLIAGIYAFLYSKTPIENPPIRLFFIGCSLLTLIALSWVMFQYSSISSQAISAEVSKGLSVYMYITISVLVIYIAFHLILFLRDWIKSSQEAKEQQEIGGI